MGLRSGTIRHLACALLILAAPATAARAGGSSEPAKCFTVLHRARSSLQRCVVYEFEDISEGTISLKLADGRSFGMQTHSGGRPRLHNVSATFKLAGGVLCAPMVRSPAAICVIPPADY